MTQTIACFLLALPLAAATISVSPSTQPVPLGNQAVVAIDIAGLGLGTAPSVGTFDLDLGFDSSVLAVNNVAFGTGLDVLGLGSIFGATPIDASTINLFELSLDLPADLNLFQPDAFTLATITFDAIGAGTSPLSLSLKALGDADGVSIDATTTNGAVDVAATVPEPSTLILSLIGLALLSRRRRFFQGATALALLAVPLTAQVQTYTNKAAFIDASEATPIAFPDWNDLPLTGFGGPDTGCGESITLGGGAVITAPNASATHGISRPICILGPLSIVGAFNPDPPAPAIAANGPDDYTITFNPPVTAIGFDIVTNNAASEQVTVRDADGNVIDTILDSDLETNANAFEFFGFTSPTPIASLHIDNDSGQTQNEGIFGVFVAGIIVEPSDTLGPVITQLVVEPNPAGLVAINLSEPITVTAVASDLNRGDSAISSVFYTAAGSPPSSMLPVDGFLDDHIEIMEVVTQLAPGDHLICATASDAHGNTGSPVCTPLLIQDGDVDKDGLKDSWEISGIDYDDDGIVDYRLQDADPSVRDIYVEIDWMDLHRPNDAAIDRVAQSFANQGIMLHWDIDEPAVPHRNEFAFSDADFLQAKNNFFGTSVERQTSRSDDILAAKRLAYHYALFVHNRPDTRSSGIAELWGDDLMVSLGGFTPSGGHVAGSPDEQASTFMHELGHNLGLQHSGDTRIPNCEPNYLSVMNYAFQFNNSPAPRPLDYSATELGPLLEGSLNETQALAGAGSDWRYTVVGPPELMFPEFPPGPGNPLRPRVEAIGADGSVDWNNDGDAVDSDLIIDINHHYGLPRTDCLANEGERLTGHNDWASLRLDFLANPQHSPGLDGAYPDELTADDVAAMRGDPDLDGVIFDNCILVPNANQADRNQDGIGDACHCDIDRNGQVDINDIRAITTQLNTNAGPLDIYDPNPDVDSDGAITILDARICVLACTHERCAP